MTATKFQTPTAADWLYSEGAPRFESHAFGEYYATCCEVRDYSAAYREFQHDPRGSELYRRYGRRPVTREVTR